MIERLCVIGVGLIGGSLALALRQAGYVRSVVGCGRDAHRLRAALDLGVIDSFETDPARAATGADMIVLAVPLGAMRVVCAALAPRLDPQAVLTDVGSAKASVLADVEHAFGGAPANFVPAHPIAGNERSGVAAAVGGLFRERRVIIAPHAETSPAAKQRVIAMWQQAGATTEEMSVGHHDWLLAATSHLPHMLAFALVDSLARMGEHDEIFRYAAGGFRDFTRIASSDPVMWRDVCLANREAVQAMLHRFEADLRLVARAIEARDGDTLLEIFQRAKQARDRFAIESYCKADVSSGE